VVGEGRNADELDRNVSARGVRACVRAVRENTMSSGLQYRSDLSAQVDVKRAEIAYCRGGTAGVDGT